MTELLEKYEIALLVVGLGAMGVAVLPRVLGSWPLSYAVIYVGAGAVLFSLPLGLVDPDPLEWGEATERLTEIGVIVALMGVALGLDRPIGWKSWRTTWLLLAVTMPLTIAGVALIGWWGLGLTPAAAILLGAVLAPTDPVLASDVQVEGPGEGEEDEVRFALTSEAGLNDGLAFPFTNLAILVALYGVAPSEWIVEFVAVDLVYKLAVGIVAGVVVGRALGYAIFHRKSPLTETLDGMVALAATLISYSLTEMANGYGFLAVFVAGLMIRRQERLHEYHGVMHDFIGQIERLLSAVVLILFGGAISTGLLAAAGWSGLLAAAAIVLVIRPLTGVLGLARVPVPMRERLAIGFFGIRGVGTFYYLAHALRETGFANAERLWAVAGLTVLISIVVHGVTASPAMQRLDRSRGRERPQPSSGGR